MDVSIQSEYLLNKVQICEKEDFRGLNEYKELILKRIEDLNVLEIAEKASKTIQRRNEEVSKLKSTKDLIDLKLSMCKKKERDEEDLENTKKVKFE